MRKLASIQKISDIQPIEGADKIDLAKVGGWQCVVNKGDYFIGDWVIFCEVDSWIPYKLAPFLCKGREPREFEGIKGERLRSIKLRGCLSQGLVLPLVVLPEAEYELGQDVSELLGIIKWEKPIPVELAGVIKGAYPSKTVKTDQERVQNISDKLPEYFNKAFEVTEKLEGSSCQFGLIDGEFLVCSRNCNLLETESNAMWQQVRRYKVEEKMRAMGLDNLMIQSEIIGEGIQGNHYGIKGQDIYVFDVYDAKEQRFYHVVSRVHLITALGLKHVPIIYYGDLEEKVSGDLVNSLLDWADGYSRLNGKKLREGLVFKSFDGTISFKAVSNKYLLKHEE